MTPPRCPHCGAVADPVGEVIVAMKAGKVADLVAHLNAHLPAAWIVCALPKPLRRRAYGACLVLGDCHLYVAATRRRVDVLALDSVGIVYSCPNAHPSRLLDLVGDAAGQIEKHHPTTAPEWAKVSP